MMTEANLPGTATIVITVTQDGRHGLEVRSNLDSDNIDAVLLGAADFLRDHVADDFLRDQASTLEMKQTDE